jgi:sortase (surface protein transpeptidase)
VRITIPAIKVNSSLQQLGLSSPGVMAVPVPGPHYNEAGWYKYSPTPGSLGPAVIVGHVDSAAEGPSVFYLLGGLKPRDQVYVTLANGSVARFAVDAVRRYPKVHFPSQLVFGNTTAADLRLVTCGGPFDSATGHYLDNIIVLASLVGVRGGPPPLSPAA